MIELDTSEIRFAIKAARQAALLVKEVQSQIDSEAITKGDKSPVTIADFASQAMVSHLLQSTFPNDPLVAEEDSSSIQSTDDNQILDSITNFVQTRIQNATTSSVTKWIDFGSGQPTGRFWTLDPIDGTKGFLRGEQYAVAFALIVKGQVQIGVLGCPNLKDGHIQDIGGPGSLIIAQKGKGTWTTNLIGAMEFKRLHVSDLADPTKARFLRSFEAGHTNVSQLDLIAGAMDVSAEPIRLDSQAKYSILASGAGDALFRLISSKMPDYKEKIWDQAAGSIICEEAGGKVTDLDGKSLDFTQGRKLVNNRGILATNGLIHDAALSAIKTIKA